MNPFPKRILRPWEDCCSHGVVSLLEMQQFYADVFFRTSAQLNAFERLAKDEGRETLGKPTMTASLYAHLGGLMTDAALYGLDSVGLQCQRMMRKMEDKQMLLKCGEIGDDLQNLRTRFEDEFGKHLFFHLTLSEALGYQEPLRGWEQICERFGDAIRDVEEMQKCLALARYAASVFHSMQVIEHGLIHLGNWLSVKDRKVGWNATTRELNRIARSEPRNRTEWENKHHGFIEQMDAVSQSLMNAWRHKIDHAAGRLTLLPGDFAPEIARGIINATHAFMGRMAIELPMDEKP